MADSSPTGGANSNQLNGWKDIAVYVGKSVRGAQRWERELGLPVHRIKTPGGQVIYALKSEIERWKLQAEGKLTEEPAEQPRETGATRSRTRGMAFGLAAAVVAIVALTVTFVIVGRRPASEPVRFLFNGNKMDALDSNGRLAWSFDFGRPVRPPDPRDIFSRPWPDDAQVRRIDLDGNGQEEVLVALPSAQREDGQYSSWVLYALSAVGQRLWSYTPEGLKLSFAGRRFEGPWYFTQLVESPGPGVKTLWLSVIHNNWWPSSVVRLSSEGRDSLQFVSSGHIYHLSYWKPGGTSFLFASGVNNEYGRAALAVVDASGAPSTSPQSPNSGYQSDGGAPSQPLRYFLFPDTEMSPLDEFPYGIISAHRPADTFFEVGVNEMSYKEQSPVSFYEITPELNVRAFSTSDSYWDVHRRLEREGRLTHTVDQCPDRTQPRRVRVWSRETGWTEQEVPPTSAARPGG